MVTAGQDMHCDNYRVSGTVVGERQWVLRAAKTIQRVFIWCHANMRCPVNATALCRHTQPCSSLTGLFADTKVVCSVGSVPSGKHWVAVTGNHISAVLIGFGSEFEANLHRRQCIWPVGNNTEVGRNVGAPTQLEALWHHLSKFWCKHLGLLKVLMNSVYNVR